MPAFKKCIFLLYFCYPVFVYGFPLKFINAQYLKSNLSFGKVPVGGLSAIYYDSDKDVFLALSDDKGRQGPPRFYTLKLYKQFVKNRLHYQFAITRQQFLVDQKGKALSIDPEGIFAFSKKIFISTEGRQPKKNRRGDFSKKKPFPFRPPRLLVLNRQGSLKHLFPLPAHFWPQDTLQLKYQGVKENQGFEALARDPDGRHFWLATESSLRQDESPATMLCHFKKTLKPARHLLYSCGRQLIRISKGDLHQNKILLQWVYPLARFIQIKNTGVHSRNHFNRSPLTGRLGLTDFLSLGKGKFLAIERAYLKNKNLKTKKKADAYYVQLVWLDCTHAENVLTYKSLRHQTPATCKRTHTMDLQWLANLYAIPIDNIEGIAMRHTKNAPPPLLILVSDNNFRSSQKTGFLFFHIPDGMLPP